MVVYNFFEGGIHLAKTAPLHIHTLPVTFGLSAFVFAGHAVFPSIYRSMKDRSQYPRMLDYTYAIVGLVCVLIGGSPFCAAFCAALWAQLLRGLACVKVALHCDALMNPPWWPRSAGSCACLWRKIPCIWQGLVADRTPWLAL